MNLKIIKMAFFRVFHSYLESQGFLKKASAYYRLQGDYLQSFALVKHGFSISVRCISLPCWILVYVKQAPGGHMDLCKHSLPQFCYDCVLEIEMSEDFYWKCVEGTDSDIEMRFYENAFSDFKSRFEKTVVPFYSSANSEGNDFLLADCLRKSNPMGMFNEEYHLLEFLYLCASNRSWDELEQYYEKSIFERRWAYASYPSFETYLKSIESTIHLNHDATCPRFSEQDRLFDWIIAKHDEGMLACKELLRIGMPRIAKAFGV